MKYGLKRVKHRHEDALSQVSWDRLESLLAVHYAAHGYQVEHCGTGMNGQRFDGGIDLKLRKGEEYILVQVKHWNACKVPHNDVHQLLGLRWNEGATGAILITSGEFTHAAIEAAKKQGQVQLIDGIQLREMIGPFAEFAGNQRAPSASVAATTGPVATRGKPAPEIPKSVRLLFAGVGLVLFLLAVRYTVNTLSSGLGVASQAAFNDAQADPPERDANPSAAPVAPRPLAPTVAQPTQAVAPRYETWQSGPVRPTSPVAGQTAGESAADHRAREAYLRSVPEI